ncbi:hypothetical protein H4S02_003483, partial [Coemansia sp. RSA 2611]
MAAGGIATKRTPRAAEAAKSKSKPKPVARAAADEESDIDMASDSDDNSQHSEGSDDDNDEEMAEPMLAGENASSEGATNAPEHKKGHPGGKPTNAEIM